MPAETGSDDAVVVVPISNLKESEMAMEDFFRDRLMADRDRHSTNATSFEKMLEMQYASNQGFRDATASRIVLEAGSGRTRSETNGPGNTAAPTA
jgi:hypothetical protein